ncbi:uncharacterized protein N7459_008365 [Penicillium hispanicum]|uniref:uncharacterized protein n=1 Tax=Penicillium hispanicum TaxID=1080232 RepID=UPI002542520B|nr:uncharacterized protein N7459_008365 [Penicillium hispanicum]KAJ5573938.1 hypothetical protein N7459_008365 [Penicillium hispanicum]
MENKIAPGLVTVSQIAPTDMLGPVRLDRKMIETLWKVFFASRKASENETDQRLEYLFWRIWSSRRILAQTDVQFLDRLLSGITASEPINIPPTTKCDESNSMSPTPSIRASPRPIHHTHSKSQPVTTVQPPLQSILKKSHNAQSEPQKTTRLLLEKPDGASIRNPAKPPSPIFSDDSPPTSPSFRPAQKRPIFPANRPGRGYRRRPVFNRRKSSQTTISKTSPPQTQPEKADPGEAKPGEPKPVEAKAAELFDPLYGLDEDIKETSLAPPPDTGLDRKDQVGTWTDSDSASVDGALPIRPGHKYTGPFPRPKSFVHEPYLPRPRRIPHPEIQTVSDDPNTPDQEKHGAEPKDPSLSEPKPEQGTAVPGLNGAKRIPMPASMENELLCILNNSDPPKEWVSLPSRPWFLNDNAWRELPEQHYLCDWMLQDEYFLQNPQPSRQPLVEKGYRQRFQEDSVDTERPPTTSLLSSGLTSLPARPSQSDSFQGFSDVTTLIGEEDIDEIASAD